MLAKKFWVLFFSAALVLTTSAFTTVGGAKRIVLERGRTIEEQMIIPNVTYIIKDYFTQTDSIITIPDNCTLAFKGGKILNANMKLGENVTIINGKIEIAENGYIQLNNYTTVKNCSFSNKTFCKIGYGDLFADACKSIRIKKCSFAPQKRQTKGKCSSIDLRRCEDFLIEKVTSNYTEGENIIIFEGRGQVRKCHCTRGWSGIGTSIYGTSKTNPKQGDPNAQILIKNNVVKNTLAAGITINNTNTLCENNTIIFENCTVEGPGIRLGHLHALANSCTVSHNRIRWINSKASGASTSNRGISIDAGNNNVIVDNIIENVPEGIASSVSNKTGTIIKNNVIKGATNYGISIYESNDAQNSCVILNNEIRMSAGTGIWVRNCNTVITSNTILFLKEKQENEDNPNSYVGLRLEDNKNVETIINDNTIRYAKMSVSGKFCGDKVVIKGNRFYSTEENNITTSNNTFIEDVNNKKEYYNTK